MEFYGTSIFIFIFIFVGVSIDVLVDFIQRDCSFSFL